MQCLELSHNQLSVLPIDVACMASSLEELHLHHNKLDTVPAELAKLTRLRVLRLEGNRITELPAQLGSMSQLEEIEVGTQSGHLRSPPPEVVTRGSASIIAYLAQMLKGEEPCNRLKLMFVGQENVG